MPTLMIRSDSYVRLSDLMISFGSSSRTKSERARQLPASTSITSLPKPRTARVPVIGKGGERRVGSRIVLIVDRLTREAASWRRFSTFRGSRATESNGGLFKEEYIRSIGSFRDAVLSILATIAKQERVRLSERIKADFDRHQCKATRSAGPDSSLIVPRNFTTEPFTTITNPEIRR